ncbi:hypothetical protein P3T76_002749 [Phytophthora citrophthora]|uniref:Uncharacterized protein n=1 Tax=Phytophthora citrophthora TaxID=4793 RepID=A0AAD9GW65_9STRA|nr:hypothetical protein P3T76_002749 [Phytophthora citrophthora]
MIQLPRLTLFLWISTGAVFVDIEDVAALQSAIDDRFKTSSLAGIASYDLAAAYDLNQPLQANSALGLLGDTMQDALVIQMPPLPTEGSRYLLLPQAKEAVNEAIFMIVNEDDDAGARMAVFFTSTLAVTCSHNLTELHTVGSAVFLAWKEEAVETVVVARNPQLDFAILKSSTPKAFVPPWRGDPDELEGRGDLTLASPLGFDELEFTRASGMSLSLDKKHIIYSCPTHAESALLISKDGLLVGIRLAFASALCDEFDSKRMIKDHMNDVDKSLYATMRSRLARGYVCLLASTSCFAMARKWVKFASKDGVAAALASAVCVDIEDTTDSKLAVLLALPATNSPSAFDLKLPLQANSLIERFGAIMEDAMVVQVPPISVTSAVKEAVRMATFMVVEEILTCDHNLADHHTVGSVVKLTLKDEVMEDSSRKSHLRPDRYPNELSELILASYRIGINLYQASFTGVLGFEEAHGCTLNPDRTKIIYSCETFPGDFGAPLLHKDDFLVGIHQAVINALRGEFDPKKSNKDRLTTIEAILNDIVQHGLPQKRSGLLVHMLKDAAQEWSDNSMA